MSKATNLKPVLDRSRPGPGPVGGRVRALGRNYSQPPPPAARTVLILLHLPARYLKMTDTQEKKVPRRLAAILAADIAGYSTLMGADEADTVRRLKEHQAVVL